MQHSLADTLFEAFFLQVSSAAATKTNKAFKSSLHTSKCRLIFKNVVDGPKMYKIYILLKSYFPCHLLVSSFIYIIFVRYKLYFTREQDNLM